MHAATNARRFHVGCSGWSYPGWKSTFYPKGLTSSNELGYYATAFDTIEIDSTFYTIPSPDVVTTWRDKTPGNFQFVAKLFKGITHELPRAVKEGLLEGLVNRYFASLGHLGSKLAATIIQFPPRFTSKHLDDVISLLNALPENIRHAIEFRDESWFENDELIERIRKQRNLSIAGSIHPDIQPFVKKTGDFYVFRFIGDRELESFGTIQREKRDEMFKIKQLMDVELQDIRDIFVFFNNHYAGFGPASTNLFREMIGLKPARFGAAGKGQSTLSEFL
nr:DUF72 domain-containing protein [Candidatus Sigynarchaeota archaeon]